MCASTPPLEVRKVVLSEEATVENVDEQFGRLSTCELRVSTRIGEEAKVSVKARRKSAWRGVRA